MDNKKIFRSQRMLKALGIGHLLDNKGEDYGNCLDVLYEEYEMTFFLVMLTSKLQRLKNLTKKEGEPNFESINDS